MSATPSIQQIKDTMRATWMAGDFGMVAKMVAISGEEFVERLSVRPGTRALDIACGTGNLAIPLAQHGAVVDGVDIATNLLDQARHRAAAENLSITFTEGDAEQLPYADATFDLVVTMFGAMFAPRPEMVVTEMARVLKPSGRVAMANWNPASFTGTMFKIGSRHGTPPHGIAPPVLWGDEATVRERLSRSFTNIHTRIIAMDFDLPFSPAGTVAFFREHFGPTNIAFSKLDAAGQAAMAADLEAAWTTANIAKDPATHTLVRNEYLEVTATRA